MTEEALEQRFLEAVRFKEEWEATKSSDSFENCIAILDEILAAHPQQIGVLKLKGLICYSAGTDLESAATCFQRMVELCPHSENYSSLLFIALYKGGDFYAAADEMEAFLSKNQIGRHYRHIVEDYWESFEQWKNYVYPECFPNVMQALESKGLSDEFE